MRVDNIILETIDKVITSKSGLILLEKLWKVLDMEKCIRKSLPKKQRQKGLKQKDKVKSLLFSFVLGNDCLSDMDNLRNDPLLNELVGGEACSRTMGDFLRSFGRRHIEQLQDLLLETALKLRLFLHQDVGPTRPMPIIKSIGPSGPKMIN